MGEILGWLVVALSGLIIVLLIIIIKKLGSGKGATVENAVRNEFRVSRQETADDSRRLREEVAGVQKTANEAVVKVVGEIGKSQQEGLGTVEQRVKVLVDSNESRLDKFREMVETQMKSLQDNNEKRLEQMRQTVDEKLQNTLEKRLGESFKQVSDRLELVHKGLGEMQHVATNVGDLKKVLTNVKNRGVLGEYQLEAILEQILTAEQYAKNVATKKGSQANVEFAIKLPGGGDGSDVWIPVDSKFPMEDYNRLLDAFEAGNKADTETSQKALIKAIKLFAKDISTKYIDPPHTTDFAIMFLPVEGIYAEVLRHPQLFESIQRDYKITITGPTTLSAFLSSLQMGFRTLAVQKRSSEVWDVLKGVKSEFNKFGEVFEKVQKQLTTASGTLETLRTTRSNSMERKLRDVESLTSTSKIEAKESEI